MSSIIPWRVVAHLGMAYRGEALCVAQFYAASVVTRLVKSERCNKLKMQCFNSYAIVLNSHRSRRSQVAVCGARRCSKEDAAPAGARGSVLGTLRGEFLRPVKKKK